ncbi:MAG: DEAD/DEAH box helicase [Phycisphaerales bacterium]|nr:DEAD/DEAH box helicase [Phycisphaerales bacterium]
MNFSELRLAEPIVRAVADKGYTTATPIQAQSIPFALDGQDVLGCAQTGTGKTCAFALPILHRLSQNAPIDRDPGFGKIDKKNKQSKNNRNRGHGRPPRALILCPTRELAMQIFESFVAYGRNVHLRHAVVFGGVSQGKQVRELRAGVDVLIATPGRLLDLVNQGHIDLSQVETLVLDEADRMLDMGFINDIRKVIELIPSERQTLFFSATLSGEIRTLADAILFEPAMVETAPESTTAELISQRIYTVEREHKAELLDRLLSEEDIGRALVFTRTKHGADKLVKVLNRSGINAEAIHGNKTQNARTRTMRRFKSGATQVLVATDIASRGIDVDDITHVVNFDMPIDPETYVHRIGRTARAGASGIAISLCDYGELGIYRSIERRTKINIEVGTNHTDLTFNAPEPMRRGAPKKSRGQRKTSGPSRFARPRSGKGARRDEQFDGLSNKHQGSSKPANKKTPSKKSSPAQGQQTGRPDGNSKSKRSQNKNFKHKDTGGFPLAQAGKQQKRTKRSESQSPTKHSKKLKPGSGVTNGRVKKSDIRVKRKTVSAQNGSQGTQW